MVTDLSRCSSPLSFDWVTLKFLSWDLHHAPMKMFYHTYNSKASRKLPNSREEEATGLGGTKFQGHDVTISTKRMDIFYYNYFLFFYYLQQWQFLRWPLQRSGLQRMPTSAALSSLGSWEDTPPTHKDSQVLSGLPTSHLPILICWPKYTYPHPNLGTPQSSFYSPGLFPEIPKGQDFWDSY